MSELISVIIPTYKRPKKLLRAVKTVLSQTHENFEILIINDDSEDKLLLEMINNLSDSRLNLYSNERTKGGNGARNTGILKSRGNYLAFLDDDDEWYNDSLESNLNILKNTKDNVGLVYGRYLMESNSKWVSPNYKKEGNLFSELITGLFSIGASSNIFIKKEILENVGLWDEDLKRQQDIEFLIRIFQQYNVVYNKDLVVKVYGHNEPNPVKAFHEREKYLSKISHRLDELNDEETKMFYSNHYRRQAQFLINIGDYKKAKDYWLKAFSYKKISSSSLRKDLKLALSLLNELYQS